MTHILLHINTVILCCTFCYVISTLTSLCDAHFLINCMARCAELHFVTFQADRGTTSSTPHVDDNHSRVNVFYSVYSFYSSCWHLSYCVNLLLCHCPMVTVHTLSGLLRIHFGRSYFRSHPYDNAVMWHLVHSCLQYLNAFSDEYQRL